MTDPKRPGRPPGRPPIDPRDPSVHVHVSLPSQTYDRVWRLAKAHDLTVPEVMRRALRRVLPHDGT